MTAVLSRRRYKLTLAGTAAAGVVGVVLMLGGAGAPGVAQAAPVPAAQAACPAPVDPAPLTRATSAFARIDGVPGDSANPQHRREVDLSGVRAGVLAGGSVLCGAGGKATHDPIVVEKQVDRASVPLAGKALTGAHLRTVRITLATTSAKPFTFLTYDLSDVRVVSIRQVKRGTTLTEEVAFDFTRIAYTYVPQNANGSAAPAIIFCYDFAVNATC